MTVLFEMHVKRNELLQGTLNDWRLSDSSDAENAAIVEEFVLQCTEMSMALGRMWADRLSRLRNGHVTNAETEGEYFAFAISITEKTLASIRMCVSMVKEKGYTIKDEADLAIEENRTQSVKREFARVWPLFSKDRIEASREAIRSGDWCSAEELLNDSRD